MASASLPLSSGTMTSSSGANSVPSESRVSSKFVERRQQQDRQVFVSCLQAVQVGWQYDDGVGERVQRIFAFGVPVMQHMSADRDHFVGQDTGALLLHGQERQIQPLQFFLHGDQRFTFRWVFGIGFQISPDRFEAGIEIFAYPADRRAGV
jgi:hypothetical protein